MFAVFFVEGMNPFYQNIAQFPTAIFTFFLLLIVLYWLVAVLGLVNIDVLDFDLPESEGLSNSASDVTNPGVLSGLMLRFGLEGVPVTVILSFITLFGWIACYYLVHFLMGYIPGGFLKFLVGVPVLFASLYIAVMVTAQVIKPLRPLFKNAQSQTVKKVLGQVAIVRTSSVDNAFGEAVLKDGGAGLILQVRSSGAERYQQGDRVVLLEHISELGVYRVISEEEFLNGN